MHIDQVVKCCVVVLLLCRNTVCLRCVYALTPLVLLFCLSFSEQEPCLRLAILFGYDDTTSVELGNKSDLSKVCFYSLIGQLENRPIS